MDETTAVVPRGLDLGRCFNDAIDVWSKNWLILAIAAFLMTSICLVSAFLLAGPITGGISIMTLEALRRPDRSVALGDMFRDFSLTRFGDRLLPLVGMFFLTTAAVVLGFAFCIIPGLVLSTLWLYCYYLVVDRDLGVFASLRVSKEIVTFSGFWMNLLLLLIGIAVEVGTQSVPYVGVILGWFVVPIAWLVMASAYIQLVDEDTGLVQNLIRAEQECARVGA